MCRIIFGNWVHTAALVDYYLSAEEVILEAFAKNSEWDLLKNEIFLSHRTYNLSGPDEHYPEIGFSLTLKRIPVYYVYNIIAPTLMLTLLSCLVYVMPAEAGEKVGLQITILLSFSVMLLVMGETMPKSGKTTPVISRYMYLNIRMHFIECKWKNFDSNFTETCWVQLTISQHLFR